MKRFLVMLLAVVMMVVAAGCGGGSKAETHPNPNDFIDEYKSVDINEALGNGQKLILDMVSSLAGCEGMDSTAWEEETVDGAYFLSSYRRSVTLFNDPLYVVVSATAPLSYGGFECGSGQQMCIQRENGGTDESCEYAKKICEYLFANFGDAKDTEGNDVTISFLKECSPYGFWSFSWDIQLESGENVQANVNYTYVGSEETSPLVNFIVWVLDN